MEESLLDSTRLDTTRHFTSRTTSYGELTHVWTDEQAFCRMQRKISACYSEPPWASQTAFAASTQQLYDIIAHFTHSRSTAATERPDM